MHKHTVMNLIWNNMILLKISPFKAATVNLTSNILSKLCFILFSTCSTLNFTSLKTGWPYFDLSCFKSVHMQKPSPMSICGLLDWGAGIYSIISWWCCNVLYSSCWERKDAICVAQVIQLVWVPYRPIWSGSLQASVGRTSGLQDMLHWLLFLFRARLRKTSFEGQIQPTASNRLPLSQWNSLSFW